MDSREREAGRRPEPTKVVVIGGGFAGRRLHRILSHSAFHVTLVDAKGYFEYTPSVLRCLVSLAISSHACLVSPFRLRQNALAPFFSNLRPAVPRPASSTRGAAGPLPVTSPNRRTT